MLFQDVIEGFVLPNFAKVQLKLLSDKGLSALVKKLDELKTFSTEFLDISDVKSFNINQTLSKKVIAHNKRVEIKANVCGKDFSLCRSDCYLDEKVPFCRLGMNVSPNKVFFALYQAKHDSSDESCYMFSYLNQSKLDKAEVIEHGRKEVFNLREIEM